MSARRRPTASLIFLFCPLSGITTRPYWAVLRRPVPANPRAYVPALAHSSGPPQPFRPLRSPAQSVPSSPPTQARATTQRVWPALSLFFCLGTCTGQMSPELPSCSPPTCFREPRSRSLFKPCVLGTPAKRQRASLRTSLPDRVRRSSSPPAI